MIRFDYRSGESGRELVSFPRAVLEELPSCGPADAWAADCVSLPSVRFAAPAAELARELIRCGFERENVEDTEEESRSRDNRERILWIAACDVREELAQRKRLRARHGADWRKHR